MTLLPITQLKAKVCTSCGRKALTDSARLASVNKSTREGSENQGHVVPQEAAGRKILETFMAAIRSCTHCGGRWSLTSLSSVRGLEDGQQEAVQ